MKNPISNPERIKNIRLLERKSKQEKAEIWKVLARHLSKSKRSRIAVNLSHINRHSKENETVVIPGKTLAAGKLSHPVKIAAFSFSKQAREKIQEAGGKCLMIEELLDENPRGSNVKILA